MGPMHVFTDPPVTFEGEGELSLSTESIDFGDVAVGLEPIEKWFKVTNVGDGEALVSNLSSVQRDSDCFTLLDGDAMFRLAPGEGREFAVRFQPPTHGDCFGYVTASDDDVIEFIGTGLAPELTLDTTDLVLPDTPLDCASEGVVNVRNDGNVDLRISNVLVDSETITLADAPPSALEPGESAELALQFIPQATGHHGASLSMNTNDPRLSQVWVDLQGEAYTGAAHEERFEYSPRAVADVLFVVDSSSSVYTKLINAPSQAAWWFDALDDGAVSWRFTVANFEQDCHATPEPWYDAYSNTDDAVNALAAAFESYDTGGTHLFELALSVLERTDDGDCLANFLRDDSQLHVVLVTDRQEESEESVAYYLDRIGDRLERNDLVFSTISGDGLTCPEAPRTVDAAERTDGVVGNLCRPNWRGIFGELAAISAVSNDATLTLPLKSRPVTSSLEVYAGERPLSVWSYDSSANTITISGSDNEIAVGETLTIRYLAAVECP